MRGTCSCRLVIVGSQTMLGHLAECSTFVDFSERHLQSGHDLLRRCSVLDLAHTSTNPMPRLLGPALLAASPEHRKPTT